MNPAFFKCKQMSLPASQEIIITFVPRPEIHDDLFCKIIENPYTTNGQQDKQDK